MKELLRSNDIVLLSFATAMLRDVTIESIVLDSHMSSLEGSIGALQRRLMVSDADYARARILLDEALAEIEAATEQRNKA